MTDLISDSIYRAAFIQGAALPQTYGKNAMIANIPQLNGASAFYNPVIQNQLQQQYSVPLTARGATNQRYNSKHQQHQHQNAQQVRIFQLKAIIVQLRFITIISHHLIRKHFSVAICSQWSVAIN